MTRRATFRGKPLVCFCTGGCMRALNEEGAPERSGVNGLCVECFEAEGALCSLCDIAGALPGKSICAGCQREAAGL